MNHPSEVDRGFFEAAEDPAGFFQPANQPLDHIPAAIKIPVNVGAGLLGHRFPHLRDDRLNRFGLELAENRSRIIRLVSGQSLGLNQGLQRRVDHFRRRPQVLKQPGLMRLSGTELDVQRGSRAVADDRDFRREPAAGTAEGVVVRFVGVRFFPPPAAQRCARTIVPSIDHNV